MTSPAREPGERWTDSRNNTDRKPAPKILIPQTQARVLTVVHAESDQSFTDAPDVPQELEPSPRVDPGARPRLDPCPARRASRPAASRSRRNVPIPDHFSAQFFVRIHNTGGPVDIWAVDDVTPNDLIETELEHALPQHATPPAVG